MYAKRIIVAGITQGVGFRPFIYRLAKRYGLKGYVINLGGSEVEIHVEGKHEAIKEFVSKIRLEAPPPARIDYMFVEDADIKNFDKFNILPSTYEAKIHSQIPPDFAICDHCLREILDTKSRFFSYPFHSCAWCGPRFSIMKRIPYDRENTSMHEFPLCELCLNEYRDPKNIRRFHAQGISCPICGPKMWLITSDGESIHTNNPIVEAAKLIDEGYIVAIKGIGGFHIASLATDDEVVLKLRKRKKRPQKPFAIMALNLEIADKLVYINSHAASILTSPRRPIVLLPEKENSGISGYVAPGLDKQGVMIAYSGIHYLLLNSTHDKFLIMTSGNRKNKPICTTIESAMREIGDFVDYFLVHNRKIINRVDDSVVRFTDGKITMIRRARGYAPEWIRIPLNTGKSIVAFGAELQNTAALGFKDKVILTQFLGDMDNLDNIIFLEEALGFLLRSYRIRLEETIFVADLHPTYTTRRIAEEWSKRYGQKLILVQHHKAHIGSVIAENGVKPEEKIVGIAIDGVGYGEDGNIWGGEIFFGRPHELERVAHLEYQPMPGGDKATKYPVRMLIGILSTFLSDGEIRRIILNNNLTRGLRDTRELDIVIKLSKHDRCVRTSSIGRVLDSVSAYLGVCFERTYEGEPAIKLEAYGRGGKILDDLDIGIRKVNGSWVIETRDIFEWIIQKEADGCSIAKTIQYYLGLKLGEIASKYLGYTDHQVVFISGGASVNDYIVRGIREGSGAEVRINRMVPAGDGGLSLGQIYMALAMEGADK